MRAKFVLILVLILAIGFGAAWHIKNAPANSGSLSSTGETNATTASNPAKPTFTIITSTPPKVVGATITPEKREAAIAAEIDHLRELAMNNDPDSLSHILADLTHPEKEVREVAIESAKEFGSSNAIPALKYAAQNNEDVGEKIALLQAAEFLTLPQLTFEKTSLTPEQIAELNQKSQERRAQREAERPTRRKSFSGPRPSGTNPWSPGDNPPNQ